VSYHINDGGARWAPPSFVTSASSYLAVLRVLAVADLAPLEPAARDELLPVRLRDHLRRDQVGGLLRAALGGDEAGGRRLLALDDPDRGLRGLGRQDTDVLPDCRRLPARDDVLHALRGRVLAAQGDRLQVMLLQVDDHGVRETVVRRGDALDVVGGLDQHLVEYRAGLLVVPARHELLLALLQGALRVQRI